MLKEGALLPQGCCHPRLILLHKTKPKRFRNGFAIPANSQPLHRLPEGNTPDCGGGKGAGADACLMLCPQNNTQNLESLCAPSDAPRRIAQRGAAIITATQRQKKNNQRLILKTLL